MAFRLVPRETDFNDRLEELSARLPRAAEALLAGSGGIEEEARAAGEAVARMIEAIDRSFLTPFDAEDIYRLAEGLATVVLAIEEAGHRAGEVDDDAFDGPIGAIRDGCARIDEGVRGLRDLSRNAGMLRDHLRAIAERSGAAERDLRRVLAGLDGEAAPAGMPAQFRRRDLDLALRRAALACREAGRALAVIVVKGA